VDISTDEEDTRRPSKLKGKQSNFRYSTLKRAADDDDGAGPSTTASNTVNKTSETSQSQILQGIVTQNCFACLSQDEIIDDGAQTHSLHSLRTNTQSHDIPRKRFARDLDTNIESEKHTDTSDNQTTTRDKKTTSNLLDVQSQKLHSILKNTKK